jgi:hypothetical protein
MEYSRETYDQSAQDTAEKQALVDQREAELRGKGKR